MSVVEWKALPAGTICIRGWYPIFVIACTKNDDMLFLRVIDWITRSLAALIARQAKTIAACDQDRCIISRRGTWNVSG